MIVVADTQIFFTQRAGGASVYWYELFRRMLDDSEIDLHLLLADGQYNNVFMDMLDLSSAHIHQERYKTNNGLRLHPPVVPDEIGENAIFHSSYMRLPVNNSIKKVITVHDFTHQKYFPLKQSLPNSVLKKKACRAADGIISISNSTQRDLFEFYAGAKNKPTVVIHNGVSDDYHQGFDPCGCGSDVIKAAEKPFLLYVGARSGYKNYVFVEKAMSSVEGFRLVVVGGEKEFDCHGNDAIIKLGAVSNQELNYLYNKAFCFVYPSHYEGFGIPVLEAMKAGCPVIAFNNSSIPEVLQGSGIMLENDDFSGFLASLSVLKDTQTRQMIVSKQQEAATFFSWDESYRKMISFYRQLLSGESTVSDSGC